MGTFLGFGTRYKSVPEGFFAYNVQRVSGDGGVSRSCEERCS